MVRTGKCGISRKIEGIKSIVLVDLCVKCSPGTEGYNVSTKQSTQGIGVSATLLPSQRFQTVF